MRVRTHPRTVDVLRYVFGDRVESGATAPDGMFEVELCAQSEVMVARQLAGFADRIEVVAPESVRRHLADIGRGLVRAHV